MGGDRVPGPFDDAVDEETRRRREFIDRHLEGKENADKLDKALARARASWLAEFGLLDELAVDVFHGRRGGFLIKYADAWLHADAWNKRLMRPVWEALIRKYELTPGTGGSPPAEPGGDP